MEVKYTLSVGGYLKTTLLDTVFIKAQAVDAFTVNADSLTSRNIATASTGKRVEITALSNNFRIYDDSDNVLVEIDDDSALENRVFVSDAVPPYWDNIFGPGIRIGTYGKTASVGRKGLVTTDSDGAVQQYIATMPTTDKGRVQLDTNAGLTLMNVSDVTHPDNASYFKNIRIFHTRNADGLAVLTWTEI